jgi:hypothetical protein
LEYHDNIRGYLVAIFIYNPLGYTVVVGDIFATWYQLGMLYGNVDGFAGFAGDGPGYWLTNIGVLFFPIHLAVSPGNSRASNLCNGDLFGF